MELKLIVNDESIQETKEYKDMFGEGSVVEVEVTDATDSPVKNYLEFIEYIDKYVTDIQKIDVLAVDNDDADCLEGFFEEDSLKEARDFASTLEEEINKGAMYYVKASGMFKDSFVFITYHLNQFMEIESDMDNFATILFN